MEENGGERSGEGCFSALEGWFYREMLLGYIKALGCSESSYYIDIKDELQGK